MLQLPASGAEVAKSILGILDAKNVPYKHMKHSPTPTSADSAEVRNMPLETGVKAIILVGKKSGKNYLINVPGSMRVDIKAASEAVEERLTMENPGIILERFGLEVGAISPFGELLGIPVYMDEAVLKHQSVAFNCGLRTESIIMPARDLAEITGSQVGKFAKQ